MEPIPKKAPAVANPSDNGTPSPSRNMDDQPPKLAKKETLVDKDDGLQTIIIIIVT